MNRLAVVGGSACASTVRRVATPVNSHTITVILARIATAATPLIPSWFLVEEMILSALSSPRPDNITGRGQVATILILIPEPPVL